MTWNLFLDDERNLDDVQWASWSVKEKYRNEEWKIARNHQGVIDLIEKYGFPSFVSFDHDLGDFIPNGDGYQVAKYLCELDMNTEYKMPENFDFYVHSKNPIGKQNIIEYLENYLRFKLNNSPTL
jgi:hypothetical protein